MQKAVAKKMGEQIQPYLEYGKVTKEGKTPMVETPSGFYDAVVAASCILRPGLDDQVLISLDDERVCYILAVLKRGPLRGTENDLYFEGNVSLHSEGGTLSLSSSEEVSLASGRLSMTAKTGEAVFEELSVTGSSLTSRMGAIQSIAGNVEHIFHRFTERLVDAFRFVKDHEEIQTGSTRYVVEENLTMHSKNAMHVAEELVSINAEQINLC
jgi:hypothetical protein